MVATTIVSLACNDNSNEDKNEESDNNDANDVEYVGWPLQIVLNLKKTTEESLSLLQSKKSLAATKKTSKPITVMVAKVPVLLFPHVTIPHLIQNSLLLNHMDCGGYVP